MNKTKQHSKHIDQDQRAQKLLLKRKKIEQDTNIDIEEDLLYDKESGVYRYALDETTL